MIVKQFIRTNQNVLKWLTDNSWQQGFLCKLTHRDEWWGVIGAWSVVGYWRWWLLCIYLSSNHINHIIGKLDILPLLWATVKVWITELTLIHKNIRSVSNSHVQELTLILKIISQCDVKHILTSLIKTITLVTYIITSITARPVRLAEILAVMSVSTFKTDVILYVLWIVIINNTEFMLNGIAMLIYFLSLRTRG